MFDKEYRITVVDEIKKKDNPLHEMVLGCTAYPVFFKPGERGWFLYNSLDVYPHRVHTSVVKDVDCTEDGTLTVTTENTRYVFQPVV